MMGPNHSLEYLIGQSLQSALERSIDYGAVVRTALEEQLSLTGLFVTLFIGVLGGIVPAWQASRADIVSSLRYT